MFEQVFENLRVATESSIHLQQEMFKKWVTVWPGMPVALNGGGEKIQKAQKKWTEFMAGLVKKERETLEAQLSAGLKNIEDAFRLAEAKEPEELRAKTIELWQKSIDCMRQTYEAQMRDFQAAVVKWTELMVEGAACSFDEQDSPHSRDKACSAP
jgi:hypothetical protein